MGWSRCFQITRVIPSVAWWHILIHALILPPWDWQPPWNARLLLVLRATSTFMTGLEDSSVDWDPAFYVLSLLMHLQYLFMREPYELWGPKKYNFCLIPWPMLTPLKDTQLKFWLTIPRMHAQNIAQMVQQPTISPLQVVFFCVSSPRLVAWTMKTTTKWLIGSCLLLGK